MIYIFGTYLLDTLNYELYDDSHLCKLDSRTFELLIYLVEHRDHIVSHDELLENLWPGQIVSEGTIHNCIKTARQAIGDSADGQHKIRTVYGRGYRFVAEAQEQRSVIPIFKAPPPDRPVQSVPQGSSVDFASTSQNVFVGNYQFVTVLCGTLEHPEALISRLGVAATYRLKQMFFARVKAEAQRHDGVFKLFGTDGFLIVLGPPVAHEDHVKRAVLAGLRLQDHLHECCDALAPQSPVEATVQMGVHTGVMEIRSPHDPIGFVTLATSETVVQAIRLHYLAEGGQLLTSQGTIPYVQDIVTYEEHDAIPMPGHAPPMVAYRICGLVPSSTDLDHSGLSPIQSKP
jgi:DNA-binding winged helix-turn-helix (wHTH) protein